MSISITRRGLIKALVVILLTIGMIGLLTYVYVFHIEPVWFSVERIEIPIPDVLPAEFHGFRIDKNKELAAPEPRIRGRLEGIPGRCNSNFHGMCSLL